MEVGGDLMRDGGGGGPDEGRCAGEDRHNSKHDL